MQRKLKLKLFKYKIVRIRIKIDKIKLFKILKFIISNNKKQKE